MKKEIPNVGDIVYQQVGYDNVEVRVLEIYDDGSILVDEFNLPGNYRELGCIAPWEKKVRRIYYWTEEPRFL